MSNPFENVDPTESARPRSNPPANAHAIEKRVLPLIEAIVNGSASDAELASLEELLAQHPAALRYYTEYVNVHSALRRRYLAGDLPKVEDDLLTAAEVTLASELAGISGQRDNKTRMGWQIIAAALAASLVAVSLFLTNRDSASQADSSKQEKAATSPSPTQKREGSAAERAAQASRNGVAVLTKLVDAQWETDAAGLQVGKPLSSGTLKLASGHVQIEFYCGATVILEGPASFDLLTTDRGFFHYGKLRAHVPARAKGFTIGTDKGDVIDLGTEFGLSVSTDGPSELHVIDGEVDFQAAVSEEATLVEKLRLLGGEALLLAGEGVPQRMNSEQNRFVGPAQLAELADSRQGRHYQRWQNYCQQIQADPSLVAHYTFEEGEGWGRTLVNHAPTSDKSTYGAIVGCDWTRGRWPMKQALRFADASHRVRVNLPGAFDSLTLASWIKIETFYKERPISLLHPETNQERFVHWSIDRVPTGGLMHFAETTNTTGSIKDRKHYSSVRHAISQSDIGQWVCLSTVVDSDQGTVSHYCDGRLVGTQPIKEMRQLGIGVCDLGNWPYSEWAKDTKFEVQNLNGLMGEFLVLGRAMDEREVRQYYEAGKP
ncbi:MAG: LamG-like jellyroll fold domain-containing protein [Lacipirellulaceae bacterium]